MRSTALSLCLILVVVISGCAGGSQPVALTFPSGSAQAIDNGQSVNITVNGAGPKGVTWSLTGPGTLSNQTSTSVTYNATATGAVLPAKAAVPGSAIRSTSVSAADPTAMVTATSVADPSKSSTVTISITPPPAISTTSLPAGTEGTAYNQTVATSGGAGTLTLTVSTGSLPAGLSMDASGNITGTPTGPNGTVTFTVKATDSSSGGAQSTTQNLNILINLPPAPAITSTSLPADVEGTAYNQTITATGGLPPYTFSATGLPAGLSMDTSGHITGTATGPSGTSNFTAKVTDKSNPVQSATQNLSIAVNLPPAPTITTASLPAGVEGTAYSQTIQATGFGTLSYSISAGALPTALGLNSGTGVIMGTPPGPNGTSNFTLSVTDSGNPKQTTSKALSITVNLPQAPSISPTTLPNGNVGSPYSQTLSVNGGLGPYTWSVSGGTLPAGLALAPGTTTAIISGMPATAQTGVAFTIKVTDSSNPAQSGTQSFTVTINAPAPLSITTTSLPNGAYNTAYSATISATGGIAPYFFSLDAASSPLPAGLALTTSSNLGVIAGMPTTAGTFTNIIVDVHDSQAPTPATASNIYTLTITASAIVISPATLPNGTVNVSYSVNITATGGVSPYTFSLDASSSALPAGLSFASNSTTATISGTPTTAAATNNIIIDVKDSEHPAVTQKMTYSITISAAGVSITTTSPLPGATLNSAYSTILTATGGVPPYAWSLTAGSALPAGLALASASPSATISGTPTATGTFQFTVKVADSAAPTPSTISVSFLLTVTGSSTLNCPATVNLTLCGTYGMGVQGFVSTTGTAIMGASFVADSSGHVVSGVEDINSVSGGQANVTITGGSYAMDASGDGRGMLTLIDSTAASRTFRFVLESAANPGVAGIEEFDSSGTRAAGTLIGPGTTPVATIPANTILAIRLAGYNGAGQRVGLLGEFQVGSSGCNGASGSFNSLAGEHVVTNTAGTMYSALTITGSCTAPDPNTGRGTIALTISGGTPFTNTTLNFVYYAASESGSLVGMLLGEEDAIAANQPILGGLAQPVGGGFTSCAAPAWCILAGSGTSDGTMTGHAVAFLVRATGTPVTTTTGTLAGVLDENFGGTITTAATWPYTSYAGDANDIGTFTGTGPTIHYIGDGSFMDESVSVIMGDGTVQNATTMESPGAPYIIGESIGSSAVGVTPVVPHVVGVVAPSATSTGTFSGTLDISSSAGSVTGFAGSGSYSMSSTTGRGTGTANFTNGASSIAVVIYGNRHRRFSVLDVQTNEPYVIGARLQ
jgi:putative Ig domain-containing protein